MHTDAIRACLFGGAIFAAGLTAADAQGGDTIFSNGSSSYSFSTAGFVGLPSGPYQYQLSFAPCDPVGVQSLSDYSGSSESVVVDGSISVSATNLLGSSNAFGSAYAYVFLNEDLTFTLEWSFGTAGICTISDDQFNVLAGVVEATGTGSETITLPPGLYALLAIASETAMATSSASITWDTTATCAADCDGNGSLNVEDIDCFVAGFLAGDLGVADCDGNGTINIDDVDCFVASFLAFVGCP